MNVSSGDGFSTPQMVQAERELDSRINIAFSRARELEAKVKEVDEKLASDSRPLTDKEVERFKAYILGNARTDEWQLVIDRIGRGELTWRQVVEGLAERRLDREVSAAFASLSKVPPATADSLVATGVLPDLNAANRDANQDADPDRADDGTPSADDEDQWNQDRSVFNL